MMTKGPWHKYSDDMGDDPDGDLDDQIVMPTHPDPEHENIHVYPINERHEMTINCWCKPRVTYPGRITHNSYPWC